MRIEHTHTQGKKGVCSAVLICSLVTASQFSGIHVTFVFISLEKLFFTCVSCRRRRCPGRRRQSANQSEGKSFGVASKVSAFVMTAHILYVQHFCNTSSTT